MGSPSESKARGASWQPEEAERQASGRGRSDLDAGQDAGPPDKSRPRATPDAGKKKDSRDAAANVPPPPAAAGGSSAAVDAEAPIPTTQPDASLAVDAAAPPDAAAALDAAAPPALDAAATPNCQPGDYTGEFSGELEAAGIPVSVVGGPISASLTLDADGLYLDMNDVNVFGRDVLGNTVWATMTGKINCTTLQLEGGQLERGRYFIAARRASLSFDGTVQGTFAANPDAIRGTWAVSATIAEIITGSGEFSLVRNE